MLGFKVMMRCGCDLRDLYGTWGDSSTRVEPHEIRRVDGNWCGVAGRTQRWCLVGRDVGVN
jgi:hypothetical protein